MLMKGSETCDAHILRIIGEIIGSIEADNSWPILHTHKNKARMELENIISKQNLEPAQHRNEVVR